MDNDLRERIAASGMKIVSVSREEILNGKLTKGSQDKPAEKQQEPKRKFNDIVPVTNQQIESMLKAIPAGWLIIFSRQLLRPDMLEMAIMRADHKRIGVTISGAKLLEHPNNNFMETILDGVHKLKNLEKLAAPEMVAADDIKTNGSWLSRLWTNIFKRRSVCKKVK